MDQAIKTAGAARTAANQAMARYGCGHKGAFDRLYGLIAKDLWAFVVSRVREPAVAEDIMQQTLLQMHRSRARFRPGASVHPWMYTIAWRLIIDRARRRHDRVPLANLDLVDVVPQPDDQVCAAELSRRLQIAFSALPARQQTALELVRAAGLSHKETAEALGTSESAVKSLVHRATRTLRTACIREEV